MCRTDGKSIKAILEQHFPSLNIRNYDDWITETTSLKASCDEALTNDLAHSKIRMSIIPVAMVNDAKNTSATVCMTQIISLIKTAVNRKLFWNSQLTKVNISASNTSLFSTNFIS